MQYREAKNQTEGPNAQEKQQRDGTEVAEEAFPSASGFDARRDLSPRNPGAAVKPKGQPELAAHAPWQNDGFKGVQQNAENDEDAGGGEKDMHGKSDVAEW